MLPLTHIHTCKLHTLCEHSAIRGSMYMPSLSPTHNPRCIHLREHSAIRGFVHVIIYMHTYKWAHGRCPCDLLLCHVPRHTCKGRCPCDLLLCHVPRHTCKGRCPCDLLLCHVPRHTCRQAWLVLSHLKAIYMQMYCILYQKKDYNIRQSIYMHAVMCACCHAMLYPWHTFALNCNKASYACLPVAKQRRSSRNCTILELFHAWTEIPTIIDPVALG